MRVVIADDEALLRDGLARLLEDAGFEVAGRCGDADALLRMVDARRPDVAIVDIRMPPGHGDDGLLAAQEIRRRHPDDRRARALAPPRLALRGAAARGGPRARRLPAQGARLRRRRARRRAAAHRRGRVRDRPDDRLAARRPQARARAARRAHRARARGARADRRGPLQRAPSASGCSSRARRSRPTSRRSSSSSACASRPSDHRRVLAVLTFLRVALSRRIPTGSGVTLRDPAGHRHVRGGRVPPRQGRAS